MRNVSIHCIFIFKTKTNVCKLHENAAQNWSVAWKFIAKVCETSACKLLTSENIDIITSLSSRIKHFTHQFKSNFAKRSRYDALQSLIGSRVEAADHPFVFALLNSQTKNFTVLLSLEKKHLFAWSSFSPWWVSY